MDVQLLLFVGAPGSSLGGPGISMTRQHLEGQLCARILIQLWLGALSSTPLCVVMRKVVLGLPEQLECMLCLCGGLGVWDSYPRCSPLVFWVYLCSVKCVSQKDKWCITQSLASSCFPKPSGCTDVFLIVTFVLEVLVTSGIVTVFRYHPWVCRTGKSKVENENWVSHCGF